jgi:parallel beta-helix repeat protein
MRFSRAFIWGVFILAILIGPRDPVGKQDGTLTSAQQQDQLSLLEQAVVQIAAFDGSTLRLDPPGSGVFIDSIHIITNAHVVGRSGGCVTTGGQLAERLFVLVTQKRGDPPVPKFTATVVQEDPKNRDLAVLRLEKEIDEPNIKTLNDLKDALAAGKDLTLIELRTPRKILKFGDFEEFANRPDLGEIPITLVGYPCVLKEGDPLHCRSPQPFPPQIAMPQGTTIVGFWGDNAETQLLRLQVPASFGDSGGAVVDKATETLIGILCGGDPTTVGGGFALARPINQAEAMAIGAGVRLSPLARFHIEPPAPRVFEPVIFDGSVSKPRNPGGQIVHYEWRFDWDGHLSSLGPQVSQAFTSSGIVHVTLKVVEKVMEQELENSLSQAVQISCRDGQPGEIRIDNRTFPTIQAAIDAARDGEMITLGPGNYCESIRIFRKRITLRGAGRDVTFLFGNGQEPVIEVNSVDPIIIQGITVKGGLIGIDIVRSKVTIIDSAASENLESGIRLDSHSSGEIQNTLIERNQPYFRSLGRGIYLDGSQNVLLIGNTIAENAEAGLVLDSNAQVLLEHNIILANQNRGIVLQSGSMATLTGDVLENNVGVGILATGDAKLKLLRVKVRATKRDPGGNFGQGIVVEGGSSANIVESGIETNQDVGLLVVNSTVEIQNHTIVSMNGSDGVRAAGVGILTELEVSDSVISGNAASGIALFNYANAYISDSYISDNAFRGIYVKGSEQTRLVVERSTITGNHLDEIVVAGSATATIKNSTISKNEVASGIFIADYAHAEIEGNTIESNAGCGIAASRKAVVTGRNNEISGNNPDLCCPVSALLRKTPPAVSLLVHVPEDVRSIQEAIDILQPGGVIIIAAGDYPSAVTITKDLTLQGMGIDKTVIRNVIQTLPEARKVTIQGVTVTKGRDGIRLCEMTEADIKAVRVVDNDETGVLVPASTYATLDEVIVERNQRGIVITDEAQATISKSLIFENRLRVSPSVALPFAPSEISGSVSPTSAVNQSLDQEEAFKPGYFAGIVTTDSAQVTVRNSKLSNNENGLVITDTARAIVEGSEIIGSEFAGVLTLDGGSFEICETIISKNGLWGVQVNDSAAGTIAISQIKENWGGLQILGSDAGVTLSGNLISGNIGIGISIREASWVEVSETQISETQQPFEGKLGSGVFIEASHDISIRSSDILRNEGDGVLISASEVHMDHNTIQDNGGCGIRADEASVVSGTENEVSGNQQGDLCGNVPEGICKSG